MINAAQVAIQRWLSMQTPESLYNVLWILSRMFSSGGTGGDSDITNWTTYNVDEETGTDETIAANPLRGQPGTPFKTIAFAIAQFQATYPLAGSYDTWANQKFILHLGAGRFTTAIQGATITLPWLRRSMAITGYGAIVESDIALENNKANYPDGVAFDPLNLPAPWTGSTYGVSVGIEFVGLSGSDARNGNDQPGLTILGNVTLTTTATVGATLQPRVQVQRCWFAGNFETFGANLTQTEIFFDAEDSIFGLSNGGRGGTLHVLGCDGPPGLTAVSLAFSAKRCQFYSRIGPFIRFYDCEDCYFNSVHYDLDFAGAPIGGQVSSASEGGFRNCTFGGDAAPLGQSWGSDDEVSLFFRADDNSLVSMAAALPFFSAITSIGLDVADTSQIYVCGATGNNVVSARGISAVPFASPSSAMAVAQDGDTVNIHPGTYTDQVIWPAGVAHLNILGQDAASTRVSAILNAAATLRITDASVRGGRIANITFEKTGTVASVAAVRVENLASDANFCSEGLVFENVVAERNNPGGGAAGLHEAFYVLGASKVEFQNCKGGISDLNNREIHAYDCEISAQGDVPNALTHTGPALGALAGTWVGSRYNSCAIAGDTENVVPGIRLGATVWIELNAECNVADSMQSLSNIVDAAAGAQVPRIISRARFEPSNAHALTFACTVTPAVVDLDGSIFVSDGASTATLTLEATANTPRQPVSLRGGTLNTLALGSKLDASVLGTQLETLTATLAAVTGSTCDRTQHVLRVTLDGGGGASITNVIPWPTGTNVEVLTSCESVVTVLPIGASFSGLAGPSAGGTVLVNGTIAAAGLDAGVMMVRRSP